MASFCSLFNELATRANECERLRKEIEGMALPVVRDAVNTWNDFGNDWKIRAYHLDITGKSMTLSLDEIENTGCFPVKPRPEEITEEEVSVMSEMLFKAFADEIPDFAPFHIVAP